MAEADSKPQPQSVENGSEERRLKYLEFVRVATLQAVLFAAKLYKHAKENSGSLKPRVLSVEGSVKNAVQPVYDKYQDVPVEILKFIDRKVDESVNRVQSNTTLKQISTQAMETAQRTPQAARKVMTEVHSTRVAETASGFAKTVYSKCEPTARNMYSKYEPVAERCAASAWQSLNKLPLFPQVAQAVGPKASYCSNKYNETVQVSAERGYRVAAYLPLVPTEKIIKILNGQSMREPAVSDAAAVASH